MALNQPKNAKVDGNGLRVYPEAVTERHGAKVGWLYYGDEATARKASEVAIHNAGIKEARGYDFGYCSPGSVVKCEKGEYANLYEVCVP